MHRERQCRVYVENNRRLIGVIVLCARRNKSESDNQTVRSIRDWSACNRFILVTKEWLLIVPLSRPAIVGATSSFRSAARYTALGQRLRNLELGRRVTESGQGEGLGSAVTSFGCSFHSLCLSDWYAKPSVFSVSLRYRYRCAVDLSRRRVRLIVARLVANVTISNFRSIVHLRRCTCPTPFRRRSKIKRGDSCIKRNIRGSRHER